MCRIVEIFQSQKFYSHSDKMHEVTKVTNYKYRISLEDVFPTRVFKVREKYINLRTDFFIYPYKGYLLRVKWQR